MPLKGFIRFLNESNSSELKELWELGLLDAADYYSQLPASERYRLPHLQVNLLSVESTDPHYDDTLIRESLEELRDPSLWIDLDSYAFEPGRPGEPSWAVFRLYLDAENSGWTVGSLRDFIWDNVDGRLISVQMVPLGGDWHLPRG